MMGGCEPEAWNYLAVVVPIAVISGPFGSLISSYLHRQVLAWFIYILDTLALVRKSFFSFSYIVNYVYLHSM
jgi:uncharacterized membrane protein YfcA